MDVIQLIGRILFSYLFITAGIGHLTATANMAGYAASRGLPNAKLAVQTSGVALIAGGASILLGLWGDLGAIGLAALLVILAVAMHAFWKETDAMAKMTETVAFNKDLALAGGALAWFFLYHYDVLEWTITGPLFN